MNCSWLVFNRQVRRLLQRGKKHPYLPKDMQVFPVNVLTLQAKVLNSIWRLMDSK